MEDPPMFKRMSRLKTPGGFNFDQVIQPGLNSPSDPTLLTTGCVAGDEDTYTVFKQFFDKVLKNRHGKITVDPLGRTAIGNYEIYHLERVPVKKGFLTVDVN